MSGITTCPKCGANLRGSEQIHAPIGICPHCKAHLVSVTFRLADEDADRYVDMRLKRTPNFWVAYLIILGIPAAVIIGLILDWALLVIQGGFWP